MLVHNRPRLTQQALDSLVASGAMKDINVTIYDDASDNETAEILEHWCMDYSAYLVRVAKSSGTAIARNSVIAESEAEYGRGDYLYLSDNDVFFTPKWLQRLVQCYKQAEVWNGKVLGAYNHPYPQHEPDYLVVPDNGCTMMVKQIQALALQSMLMEWSTWDKYGPFPKTPVGKVCQGEDVEFGWKIAADKGKLCVVHPPLIVNTGITNSFGEHIPGWELVQKQAPLGVIVE